MAGLLDLFGGDSTQPGALYGGLLTPQQNSALAYRGLLAAAGALGQAAMPSRMPIPIGAAFGNAAAAMGTAQDEAGSNALKGQLVGLQGEQIRNTINRQNQFIGMLGPYLQGLGGQGAAGGASPASATGGGMLGSPAPNADVSANGPMPEVSGPDDIIAYGKQVAAKYGIPWDVFSHQIAGESNWNPKVDASSAGAQGIAQFIPGTAKTYGVDVNDWKSSLDGAGRYMSDLYNKGGSWQAALTGYLTGNPRNTEITSVSKINPQYAAAYKAARTADSTPTQVAQANTGTATDESPDYGVRPAGARPIPPQIPRNSLGQPYMPIGPGGSVAAGTPGAGPSITAADAAAANAGGGNRLPVMPSNYVFGNGQVAPPGAGTVSPAAPQGLLPAPQAPGSDTLRLGGAVAPQMASAPQGLLPPPTATPFTNAPPVNRVGAPAPGPPQGMLASGPPQMPQAAPRVPIPPAAPAFDPRATIALGLMGDMAGFPSAGQLLTGTPQYKGAVSAAEAEAQNRSKLNYAGPTATATKNAENTSDLFFKPKIAGATALAESPFKAVRPGGSFPEYDANGNITGWNQAPVAPERITQYDPATGMGYPGSFTPQSPFGRGVPGLGGNAPAGTPAGPQSQMPTELGPSVKGALEERAKAEQKDRQATIDAGGAAQLQQATLQSMKADVPNFYTGPFADHLQEAKSILRLFPGGDTLADSVKGYEDFTKNAGALTRQAVHDTSPRAAVQEFKLIGGALPNPEMSPAGLNQVLNEYMGLNDYRIAKTQAQQAWEQQQGGPGRVTGFETDWQSKVSPHAFIMMRMDPVARQKLFAQVGGTKEGQAELQHLAQQMQFIQQSGLEKFIQ
jgi:hypothetical protein